MLMSQDETHLILIRLHRNQTLYPNVLLTLTSKNDEGDADLYCFPSAHLETDVRPRRFNDRRKSLLKKVDQSAQ